MASDYDRVPARPWEQAVYDAIRTAPLSTRQRAIVAAHLFRPTVPARQLMRTLQVELAEVKAAYGWLQEAPVVREYTTSPFYSRRLLYAFARATVGDWLADPAYARRLLRGEPVASRVVEIHATPGSCQYRCAMCLWSDKQEFTYARQGLAAARYLEADTWLRTLAALREYGAHTVVLSGGGEPLLHPELPRLIRRAGALGYRVHLYTNGFNLARQADALSSALLAADRVRVSLHSPYPATYDQIVGLPARAQALAQVCQGVRQLLAARAASGSSLQVGIGFVVQPLNVQEISAMCAFARDLGVDFLNVRQDEVAVTTLTPSQQQHLRAQLVAVRQALVAGAYAGLHIDFSDDLTALANGEPACGERATECFAKYYRPAISPFGLVAACDLIAEPRFATAERTFGSIAAQPVAQILATLPRRRLSADCAQCMPSGRSGNLVYAKLLQDYRLGIDFAEQPFAAPPLTPVTD